jgi:regulator of protease activity HflC (stomatin/prohibitin superfamily)
MKTLKLISLIVIASWLLQSCAIVRPGQVGVDVHFGKVKSKALDPGPHHFFALFGRKIVRFDTRVTNYSNNINFHTKEGIEVTSEITLLYHIVVGDVINIYKTFGEDYQEKVIEDNLITILRQTGLQYSATELITERANIEKTVKQKMDSIVGKYGFETDLVMLKQVDLPANVIATIQAKLNAEETAKKTVIDNEVKRNELDFQLEKDLKLKELEIQKQRLDIDFSIEKQKKEAERILIEAEAIKKQQEIVNSTLTDKLIKLKSLEITRDLVKSNNTKIIISDGKSPVILNDK